MDTQETPKVDLSSLLSMDFTPDWAKKDAGITVGKITSEREVNNEGKPAQSKKPFGDKKPFKRENKKSFGDRGKRFEQRVRPLEAEVKVLPESKALGTIFRKLQQDSHAYKLKDLAYFFLDNLSSVLLKIVPKNDTKFYQCKACGFAALSQDDVVNHILTAHLSDYYEAKEIECEPPKGAFNCVAKCGLSGVLLGPPNVHEFNATVKEILRTKYPNMSESEYRSHIEMVRDEAAIEEWRKSAVKKTVYVVKGSGEGAMQLTREQAEAEFKRNILSSIISQPKHLMITADVAMKSPVKSLTMLVKSSLEIERRQPFNMIFALRGAFHHRKMHFFRANDARGPEFVSNIEYKAFDSAHAIPELAKIADFVAANPCQPKSVIAPDEESEKQLNWLVSTGHIVAFTNGVYSAVEKFPKYGPQWQKKASESGPQGAADPTKGETENLKEEEKDESSAKLAE